MYKFGFETTMSLLSICIVFIILVFIFDRGFPDTNKTEFIELREDKPIVQEVDTISSENLEDTIKRLITEEKEVKEQKTYTEDELKEIIKEVLNENN